MTLRAILLTLLLVACQTGPKPNPNYPQPEGDGAASCPAACKRGEELKCIAAQPSPNGKTCLEVCKASTPPALSGWRPSCQAKAETCIHFDECVY